MTFFRNAPLCLIQFTFHSSCALWTLFGALFFTRQGFNGIQLGIFLTIPMVLLIFVPLLWGVFSDWFQHRKTVLVLLNIFSAALFGMVWLEQDSGFLTYFFLISILEFFFTPQDSLLDSLVLDYVSDSSLYGRIRSFGSLGYLTVLVSMTFILGPEKTIQPISDSSKVTTTLSELRPIFFIICGALIACGLCISFLLPNSSLNKRKVNDSVKSQDECVVSNINIEPENNYNGYWYVLTSLMCDSKALVCLLSRMFRMIVCYPSDRLFGIYLDTLGISDIYKGLFVAVAIMAEIIALSISPYLLKHVGAFIMMFTGSIALFFRELIYYIAPSWEYVIFAQLLHSLTYATFTIASIDILNQKTPKNYTSTTQTILAGFQGVGGCLGALAMGSVINRIGIYFSYFLLSLFSLSNVIIIPIGFYFDQIICCRRQTLPSLSYLDVSTADTEMVTFEIKKNIGEISESSGLLSNENRKSNSNYSPTRQRQYTRNINIKSDNSEGSTVQNEEEVSISWVASFE